MSGQEHEMWYPMKYQSQETSGNDNQEPDNNGAHAVSSITVTMSGD